MSKPEDISQEAWLSAGDVIAGTWAHDADLQASIARAIMAAEKQGEARERECAAQDIENECARILSKQDGKDPGVDANLRLIACILPGLADAVRKRGEVSTAHKNKIVEA